MAGKRAISVTDSYVDLLLTEKTGIAQFDSSHFTSQRGPAICP